MSTVQISRVRQVSIPLFINSNPTLGIASMAAALMAADTPYFEPPLTFERYRGSYPNPQVVFNDPSPQARGISIIDAKGSPVPFNLNAASQLLDFGTLIRRRVFTDGNYIVNPTGSIPQAINYFPSSQDFLKKIIPSIQLGLFEAAPEISSSPSSSAVSLNVSRAITSGVSLPFSLSAVYACNSNVFNNRLAIESILSTGVIEQRSFDPYVDLPNQLTFEGSEGTFISLDANFVENYTLSVDPRLLENDVTETRDLFITVPFSSGCSDLPSYTNSAGTVPITSAARSTRFQSNGGNGALGRYIVPLSYLKEDNFSRVADYNFLFYPGTSEIGLYPSANIFVGTGAQTGEFPGVISTNVRVGLKPITSSAITELDYGGYSPSNWGPFVF